jgi:hypothetical protein
LQHAQHAAKNEQRAQKEPRGGGLAPHIFKVQFARLARYGAHVKLWLKTLSFASGARLLAPLARDFRAMGAKFVIAWAAVASLAASEYVAEVNHLDLQCVELAPAAVAARVFGAADDLVREEIGQGGGVVEWVLAGAFQQFSCSGLKRWSAAGLHITGPAPSSATIQTLCINVLRLTPMR